MKRRRWQVDLRQEDELVLERAKRALGAEGDSDTGRALLALFSRLAAAIEQGTVISFLPGDDPRAIDAIPELTAALRAESRYRYLVAVPHRWRRQLMLKGRRITAGQLVSTMDAENWSVDDAAREFELDPLAVAEAVDYVSRSRALIEAEAVEERRQAEPLLTHRAPTPR
jgi:hypothetical protein